MKPFSEKNLKDYLDSKLSAAIRDVESFTNDEIMANSVELLTENVFQNYYVETVIVHEEDLSRRSSEQIRIKKEYDKFNRSLYNKPYIEADGVAFAFFYPYEGDKNLFYYRASRYYSLDSYPDIDINTDSVKISFERALSEIDLKDLDKQFFKLSHSYLSQLKQGIEYANDDVRKFNNMLRTTIYEKIDNKRKNVSKFYEISKVLSIPIEKNDYAKTHITVCRRIKPIKHIYDNTGIYCIEDTDYRDILTSIKHTLSTYERTPYSYRYMHEEDLRNTLIAALNATYKGNANGETFRKNGKTDISIERDNRAAFIAECKMWKGKKQLENALLQLDSYTTWRDCKNALIVFSRNKNFNKVINDAKEELTSISLIKKMEEIDKNEFHIIYNSKSNFGFINQIRIQIYNLYFDDKSEKYQ